MSITAIWQNIRWRTRLILWSGACAGGLVIVVFAKLCEFSQNTFFNLIKLEPLVPLFLTPIVGGLVVWLTNRFFKGVEGSGIPQLIAATKLAKNNKDISRLVSFRIAIGKVLLSALGLFGGFSIGREGPSVQVSASILKIFHQMLPNARVIRLSDLLLAGGAAGIAAAFNTPLAGIVFAIEELGKRFESRTSAILISSIVLSGLVAISLQGNYQYFGHFSISGVDEKFLFYVPLMGIICGILGGVFSLILLTPISYPNFIIWQVRNKYPVVFAMGCGFLVAIVGFISNGATYGNGYGLTAYIMGYGVADSWWIFIGKYLATIASYFSGIPGGIFAPSLSIGSAIGGAIYEIVGQSDILVPMVALCMAGFLAAVTQAPITSAIIVMEMIDGHQMLIGLLAVTFIAKVISGKISPELYQRLSLGFLR